MANTSTTVLPMPQLVDLALSAPEVGVVNFTILHSLLHVLINQLELGDCNVEFRGTDSERLQSYMNTAKPGPKIVLTEYTVSPDGKQKRKGGTAAGRRASKVKRPSTGDVSSPGKGGELKQEQSQTIVVVEKASKESFEPPQFTIALTKEQMNKMQSDMKKLQNQVKELTDLPGNLGIINAIRAHTDQEPKPVLEMFQILTLVRRLDATEEALSKMASMLEDLAKETSNIAKFGQSQAQTEVDNEGEKLKESSANAMAVMEKAQELRGSFGSKGNAALEELDKRVTDLELTMEEIKGGQLSVQASVESKKKKKRKASKSVVIEGDPEARDSKEGDGDSKESLPPDINVAGMLPQEAIAYLQKEMKQIRSEMDDGNALAAKALKDIEIFKEAMQANTENLPPDMKMAQLELKINNIVEQMNVMNNLIGQQFGLVQIKFNEVNNEIQALWEKLNSGDFRDANEPSKANSFMDLYNKLVQLRSDIDDLHATAEKLLSDREKKQNTLDVIIEQIEMLKSAKADREDLEDALADKADACQINRKVSYDQFDAAYDNITKQLTETLDKLERQEDLWSQALTDVQKEIGNKLDKMELTPLKDFINMKLKNIQEKFKKISAMKQEHEAAGTKSKYLRNVNCISCDAQVVMKKEIDSTLFPRPYSMPPSKSMGPYLAYELDELRKQAKSFPNKNMNMFEGAIHYGKQKPPEKDHICNRYCGGSHTVTTPQQRVTRIGHFMEQWGPEITPVEDVLIKGNDGQLYRGNADALIKQSITSKTTPPPPPTQEAKEETETPVKEERLKSLSAKERSLVGIIPSKVLSGEEAAVPAESPEADAPPPPEGSAPEERTSGAASPGKTGSPTALPQTEKSAGSLGAAARASATGRTGSAGVVPRASATRTGSATATPRASATGGPGAEVAPQKEKSGEQLQASASTRSVQKSRTASNLNTQKQSASNVITEEPAPPPAEE